MRVADIMTGTPYKCGPEANLGSATELMWKGNCGFLPVVGTEGKVVGVITDRDICVALGTRGRPSGQVTVSEAMSRKVFSARTEDDVQVALRTMREARVRRLPVVDKGGVLVGVVSIDDVLLRGEVPTPGMSPQLLSEEVLKTFQAISVRPVLQGVAKQSAAA